jgi:chromate transporter
VSDPGHPDSTAPVRVSLPQLTAAFVTIGATSFGGGVTGYIRRVVVEERRWLDSDEFLRGLSVAQVVPGPNAVNLAIFIGYRLSGPLGALLAALGVLVVPVIALAGLTVAWGRLGRLPAVAASLRALGAFGAGLMGATGFRIMRAARFKAPDLALAAIAFVTVGVLHWPVPGVLLGLAPASIMLHQRGSADGRNEEGP